MTSVNAGFPRLTFWRMVLVVILATGLYSTWLRFSQGLGATTALSDEFPWGLWIGFDVLCGVALAAGGFTISAIVYVFRIKRFEPIVRPAILTAFLGYGLVVVGLIFDLGRGDRLWHPLVMWNPHSIMFEVAWCVMLYSTILALEFSPMLLERIGWSKPLKMVKSAMIPLVILGVVLSTLHQSSLGALYLIVPGKLHALWYSPWLPLFFIVSAVALGAAMTIFESFLSHRAFRRRIELDLLSDLGKVIVVVLGLYLVLRLADLTNQGALAMVFESSYEGRLFQSEILLGVIAPILLLLIPAVRRNDFGLFASALMVISGFLLNRLNVSLTGLERSAGVAYQPSWIEVSVTLSLVALGFFLFALAARYLRVFPEPGEEGPPPELPAVVHLRAPWFSTTKAVMVTAVAVFALAVGLAWDGVNRRPDWPKSGAAVVESAPAVLETAELGE
jgi:Ni/Fe-hydrogenase subunit HybB-like protein